MVTTTVRRCWIGRVLPGDGILLRTDRQAFGLMRGNRLEPVRPPLHARLI